MTVPCAQQETIGELKATLGFFRDAEIRREQREERQLRAMENIAAHGATLTNLVQRTSKLETDVGEAFGVFRTLNQSAATAEEVNAIDFRVTKIEMLHERESGEQTIENTPEYKQQKFWAGVKQQFTVRSLMALCFMVWVIDKYNLATRMKDAWDAWVHKG